MDGKESSDTETLILPSHLPENHPIFRTWAEFTHGLNPEQWDGDMIRRGLTTPFLTFDWLDCWQTYFAPDTGGVWSLPGRHNAISLMFTNSSVTRHGPVSFRTLRCFRNSHSQRAALVPGETPEHLLSLLVQRCDQWDLLYLDGVPDHDGLPDRLTAEACRLGATGILTRRFHHVAVPTNGDWESYYYGSERSRKKRANQERLGRQIETNFGPLRCNPARGAEAVAALDQHLELELRSWKADRGEVIFDDPVLSAFYREIGKRFAIRDRLQMDMLYVGTTHVASMMSLEFAGTRLALKMSYDETVARYSPGWLIIRYMLEHAFSQPIQKVDFYGDYGFLDFWAEERIPLADVLVFSPSVRGRLMAGAWRVRNALRQTLS